METNWIHSKWKKDDLDGKTVETKRASHSVIAMFIVKSDDTGLLSIVVRKDEQVTPASREQRNRVLQQEEAELIQGHPNPSVAVFLLAY
jgi:hypothetical protein